jgi:hypothetical protein
MQGGTHTRHMQLERRHTQTPSPALQVSLRLKKQHDCSARGRASSLSDFRISLRPNCTDTRSECVYDVCVCMTGQADIHLATLPGETLRI